MGTSTDAILLYGIPLKEGAVDDYDEDDETLPQEGPAYMAWDGAAVDGIQLVRHCSKEAPMYFVAIAGTVVRAWRGSPRKFNGMYPDVSEWNAKLVAFVEKHHLAIEEDFAAAWYIASYWG